MQLKQHSVILFLVLACIAIKAQATNQGYNNRRGIEVTFSYTHETDGFGNNRSVAVSGSIKNTTDDNASRIDVDFEMEWAKRSSTSKKIKFRNLEAGETKPFEFTVDLGARPDILNKVTAEITKIKFTKTRLASAPSKRNIISHEKYTLERLNEEGKAFLNCLIKIKEIAPFKPPIKDEFETTDEFDSRINIAENECFSKQMDLLEEKYGEILGGKGAVVRYIPRIIHKELVYVSENSAYFEIPIRFGKYDADNHRYNDINLNPRTFPFPPKTVVPNADLEIIHKSGIFFLRRPYFDVNREEAVEFRKNEENLIMQLSLKTGVIQEGPYAEPFCVIDEIVLKDSKSNKIYRQWSKYEKPIEEQPE